jgi:hypothetical protein
MLSYFYRWLKEEQLLPIIGIKKAPPGMEEQTNNQMNAYIINSINNKIIYLHNKNALLKPGQK